MLSLCRCVSFPSRRNPIHSKSERASGSSIELDAVACLLTRCWWRWWWFHIILEPSLLFPSSPSSTDGSFSCVYFFYDPHSRPVLCSESKKLGEGEKRDPNRVVIAMATLLARTSSSHLIKVGICGFLSLRLPFSGSTRICGSVLEEPVIRYANIAREKEIGVDAISPATGCAVVDPVVNGCKL